MEKQTMTQQVNQVPEARKREVAREVVRRQEALTAALDKFRQQAEEYGVEYAFRHGGPEVSRADQELTFSAVFHQVLQHPAGGEKLAWQEVQSQAICALTAGGGSSLFSVADQAARRGVASSWLDTSMKRLAED